MPKFPTVLLMLSFVSTFIFRATGEIVVTVDVNLDDSNANVDGLFVSNSMPHKISKWKNMPFRDTKFRELFKALAPSSLRVLANPKKHVENQEVQANPRDGRKSEKSRLKDKPKERKQKIKVLKQKRSEERASLHNVGSSSFSKGGTMNLSGFVVRSNFGHFDHRKADQESYEVGKFDHGKAYQKNSENAKLVYGNADQENYYPERFNFGKVIHSFSNHELLSKETSTARVSRVKRGSSIKEIVYKSEADMSFVMWEEMYSFVQYVGWDISMDFTNLDRKEDGTWDSSAADEFLKYLVTNNVKIPDFQLGNEPNLYPQKYNISGITAENTLQDFQVLRDKLKSIDLYKNSKLVGPETTRPSSSREFFKNFLEGGGCKVVDEISFHQYYRNIDKHSPTVNDFLNTSIMDLLELQFSLAKGHLDHYKCNKAIRLTESSSISGGLPDIADRFVAGFLWLDKLGVAARSGVTRVYRFNIWGGSYSLLDRETFEPNPDYYLTLLYKRLVEGKVFNVTTDNKHARAYANDAKPLLYNKGSLVIYVVNVLNKPVKLVYKQYPRVKVDTYFFTPGDNTGILSKTVKVSGILMKHTNGGSVTFQPQSTRADKVQMPAQSFGFIVVPKSPEGRFEEVADPENNSAYTAMRNWNGLRLFVLLLSLCLKL